jgi:hypothetical protein
MGNYIYHLGHYMFAAPHFIPVATRNTQNCGVHISTDDVVLCAPPAAKIPNHSTTSERTFIRGVY